MAVLPPELSIRTGHAGDGVVELAVDGLLDANTAAILREELHHLFDRGVRWVVLDLAELSFLDSAGLGVLVGGFKRYQCGGGRLDLRGPNRLVRRVLDVTGVGEIFGLEER